MDWAIIFGFGNFIVVVGGIIAGRWVIKSSLAKSEGEIKDRVLNDLGKENEFLRNKVDRVEKDNRRLENLFQLLISTLKKTHRIDIEIDGDIIVLRTQNGIHTARIDSTDLSA